MKKIDPLQKMGDEIREGTYSRNVALRARRRKSPWNLLLPLFGIPLLMFFSVGSIQLVWVAHVVLHPNHTDTKQQFWHSPPDLYAMVMILLMVITSMVFSMIITNFLVYLIPPARRAMEKEDRPFPELDFRRTQIAFAKICAASLLATVAFALVGVAIGRLD